MKKIILILFFIIVVLNFTFLTYDSLCWYPVSSGTTRCLNDIFFVNANTGWAGGDSVLLKTTNGGLNWVSQSLPVQIKIRSLYFLNENTGYIAGDRSNTYESYIYILKTNNSGNSWNIINYFHPTIFCSAYSNDVYAFNENSILKTYAEYLSYTSSGAILQSTDGGLNFNFVLNSGVMKGLSFINSQTGWTTSESGAASPISGVYKIYKTTNQGNNWFVTLTDSHPTSGPVNSRGIQFLNSSTGYALGYYIKPILFKTINGGTNWSTDSLDNHNSKTMYFADANTGWIGGYTSTGGSNISKTTNGGLNWIKQNIGGTEIINKIFFINSYTGWAVGYYGAILRTLNGGVTTVKNISGEVPNEFSLEQNYPNPFNSMTNVKFKMLNAGNAVIKVFDISGKEVVTLVNEYLRSGTYETTFDASTLTGGIYFYRLQTENYTATKKLILLK
ncbi:MAG: T9SS type A sorting domain-containing protein [Ignavibacteria bacterium]|nr:T9SS type A sorting domain-containing protein [Ignavibacteria bacterium]